MACLRSIYEGGDAAFYVHTGMAFIPQRKKVLLKSRQLSIYRVLILYIFGIVAADEVQCYLAYLRLAPVFL